MISKRAKEEQFGVEIFFWLGLKTLNSDGIKRFPSVFPLFLCLTKFGAKLGRVFPLLFCVDIQTIQKSARKDRERERERESGERESFSGEAKEE